MSRAFDDDETPDVEHYRSVLLRKLEEHRVSETIAIDPNRVDPTARPDEDAQPLNEMNQVIASRRNRQRAMEIESIEAALSRIELDPEGYGYCVECEEPIKSKRLELMPWTTHCVACQSKKGDGRGYRRRHALDFLE